MRMWNCGRLAVGGWRQGRRLRTDNRRWMDVQGVVVVVWVVHAGDFNERRARSEVRGRKEV